MTNNEIFRTYALARTGGLQAACGLARRELLVAKSPRGIPRYVAITGRSTFAAVGRAAGAGNFRGRAQGVPAVARHKARIRQAAAPDARAAHAVKQAQR